MIACPFCKGRSAVIDSRAIQSTIRRRRKCLTCSWTWTTFEVTRDAYREATGQALTLQADLLTAYKAIGKLLDKSIEISMKMLGEEQ